MMIWPSTAPLYSRIHRDKEWEATIKSEQTYRMDTSAKAHTYLATYLLSWLSMSAV